MIVVKQDSLSDASLLDTVRSSKTLRVCVCVGGVIRGCVSLMLRMWTDVSQALMLLRSGTAVLFIIYGKILRRNSENSVLHTESRPRPLGDETTHLVAVLATPLSWRDLPLRNNNFVKKREARNS